MLSYGVGPVAPPSPDRKTAAIAAPARLDTPFDANKAARARPASAAAVIQGAARQTKSTAILFVALRKPRPLPLLPARLLVVPAACPPLPGDVTDLLDVRPTIWQPRYPRMLGVVAPSGRLRLHNCSNKLRRTVSF